MADIASNWKALSGLENNWEGLLDPIDDNLRRYLVHYGERVGAVGDAFNDVKVSDAHGLCRFPPDVLFIRTGLEKGNPFKYQVTDYFYTRLEFKIGDWSTEESAFMGYVAVATDEGKLVLGRRDILICWRGTLLPVEMLEDFNPLPVSAPEAFPDIVKVHQGFLSAYVTKNADSVYSKTSARQQVLAAVRRLVDKYAELKEDVSITVAGYSLGAALATLNAMDIVFNGYNKPTGSTTGYPVTAFVYASPRIGNKHFKELFDGLTDLHLLRIRNALDVIPDLPPDLTIPPTIYYEVGVELYIDTQNSKDTKKLTENLSHDLNLYLYGIAAYQGSGKDLKLAIDFDVAILNKYNDILDETLHKVPPNWWSNVMYKGLVQKDNGFWELNDYFHDPPAAVAAQNGIKPLKN